MVRQLREMIRQLDRRDIVKWVPEMKLGKPAYEHLKTALFSPQSTANQIRNIMHALYVMRFHGNPAEVLQLCMRFVEDDRIKVRSKAVHLAVAMYMTHRDYPKHAAPLLGEDLWRVKAALVRGVEKDVDRFAREILEFDPPALESDL